MDLPKIPTLNKKIVMIVLGVVVLVELLASLWFLMRPQKIDRQPTNSQTQTNTSSIDKPTLILLSATESEIKTGSTFTVAVNLDSSKMTDGVDLILTYDPKVLKVQKSKLPFQGSTLYSDYLINTVDESKGRLVVSGITSSPTGVLASGLFGTVTFQAKGSGKTNLSIEFAPGSTTDTNVTETKTGKDLLTGVQNLEVNILP